jgi:hypothetical protein
MSDWPWVIASYGLTWIVLGGYGLELHRRGVRAAMELAASTRGSDPSEPQMNQEVEG